MLPTTTEEKIHETYTQIESVTRVRVLNISVTVRVQCTELPAGIKMIIPMNETFTVNLIKTNIFNSIIFYKTMMAFFPCFWFDTFIQ